MIACAINVDFAYPMVGRRVRGCEVVQVGGSSPHLVPADERPFDGTAFHPGTTSPIPEKVIEHASAEDGPCTSACTDPRFRV